MEYDKNKVVEPIRMREIFIEEKPMKAAVYRREDLTFGDEFAGPAIVEQFDTTTLITKDFTCRVDEFGNLCLFRS